MTTLAVVLEELHRILLQIADLRSRIARGPRQIAAAQAQVVEAEKQLVTLDEERLRLRKSSEEKQRQLTGREQRVVELQGKLNQAASNREYTTITEQIAADEQANSVLSDEILECLERIDDQLKAIAAQQAEIDSRNQELEAVKVRVADTQATLESEVARLEGDLADVEKRLPSDMKPEYQRLTKARGEDALAAVVDDGCDGCNTTLTTNVIEEMRMNRPHFCRNCGRILYLPNSG